MKKILLLFIIFSSFLHSTQQQNIQQEQMGTQITLRLISNGFTRGICIFKENVDNFELINLKIFDKEQRGQGYGSQLLKKVLLRAQLQNMPVCLSASPFPEDITQLGSTEKALQRIIKFYKKHGAEVNAQHTEYADMVFPPIIM